MSEARHRLPSPLRPGGVAVSVADCHLATGAVLLVTREGDVIAASLPAQALIGRSAGLVADQGRLTARRADESRELGAAISGAGLGQTPEIVTLRTREGVPTVVVRLSVVAGSEMVLALCVDMTRSDPLDAALCGVIFAFTPAETRIALALAGGATIAVVALDNGLSQNTVKTHLRRVFVKAGVSSQVQLAVVLRRTSELNHGWVFGGAPDR